MKIIKISALLVALCLLFPVLLGCEAQSTDTEELSIVSTVFPYYDWTKNLIEGTDADLSLLVKNGTDLHSYNASVFDIVSISSCDLLIMTGGESDAWVEEALKEVQNKDIVVIRLLDILQPEGLALALENEHEHEHDDICEHTFDEHIWLSPAIAMKLVESISSTLCKLDSENAMTYSSNAAAYIEKLSALDTDYKEELESIDTPLLFADRFPFRYLVNSYGLEYFAAFDGCSADFEASFATVTTLASIINEHSLSSVFVTESSTGDIARSVIAASNKKDCAVIALDSMQSLTEGDIKNGADYIEIMKNNLHLLKEGTK